jgi:hypothetical protein
MLILLSAALFGFGLLLFGLGLAAWLIGLAIQIAIWVFQLVLLIVWAGTTFCSWMQPRTPQTVFSLEATTVDRIGRAPPLRGNIRTKHGSRRVPHLTIVE